MATKVLEYDIAGEPRDLIGLGIYSQALVLFRWRRRVLGQARLAIDSGVIPASSILRTAYRNFRDEISSRMVEELVAVSRPARDEAPANVTCSIVVCTRDRNEDLRRCLTAARTTASPETELVVVDNAPSGGGAARLATEFAARYVLELRRGLNWARTRGAEEATGDVVIYIDDDATPATGWLEALREPFANPEVAAVTGLVMPAELETAPQEGFERYCGFARGFRRKEFTSRTISPLAAANVGAGACMAIRRNIVNDLSLFRVEMDCGTATRSGGDTYAFYRLLSLGYRIVYNPDAVVWHRHRRTEIELRQTLAGYSVGTYAFLLRALVVHGEIGAFHIGFRWFVRHHLRSLLQGLLGDSEAQPLSLTGAEIGGVLAAPGAYCKSRRDERRETGNGRGQVPASRSDSP
jgi:GT2 family glycosyltransferase